MRQSVRSTCDLIGLDRVFKAQRINTLDLGIPIRCYFCYLRPADQYLWTRTKRKSSQNRETGEARVKHRMFSVIRSAAAHETANKKLFFFFCWKYRGFLFQCFLWFWSDRKHYSKQKRIHDLINLSKRLFLFLSLFMCLAALHKKLLIVSTQCYKSRNVCMCTSHRTFGVLSQMYSKKRIYHTYSMN